MFKLLDHTTQQIMHNQYDKPVAGGVFIDLEIAFIHVHK